MDEPTNSGIFLKKQERTMFNRGASMIEFNDIDRKYLIKKEYKETKVNISSKHKKNGIGSIE